MPRIVFHKVDRTEITHGQYRIMIGVVHYGDGHDGDGHDDDDDDRGD